MIHIVIMASGFSRRMGQDKLLMTVGGKPVIQWVVEASRQSGADTITLIYRNPELLEIAEAFGISAVYNPEAETGQSAALRLAVSTLPRSEAYIFVAGDQPLISPETLRRLIRTYRQKKPDIVSAAWQGHRTLPVLFAGTMAEPLLALTGDQGGRALIGCGLYDTVYVELVCEEEAWDIDTPDELKKLETWMHARMTMGSWE